jgi:DHA2 family multidrug resistance protein
VVSYLLVRNDQVNHATLASHVTAFNHAFDNSAVREALNPLTAAGRAALDHVIQTQASIISYVDDFKLMMIMSLAVIPLLLLVRETPRQAGDAGHAAVMD